MKYVYYFLRCLFISIIFNYKTCYSQLPNESWKPVGRNQFRTLWPNGTVGNSVQIGPTPSMTGINILQGVSGVSGVSGVTGVRTLPMNILQPILPAATNSKPVFTLPGGVTYHNQQQQQGIMYPPRTIQTIIYTGPKSTSALPALPGGFIQNNQQPKIWAQPSNIQNTIVPSPSLEPKIMMTPPLTPILYFNNQQKQQQLTIPNIQNILQAPPKKSILLFAPPGVYNNNRQTQPQQEILAEGSTNQNVNLPLGSMFHGSDSDLYHSNKQQQNTQSNNNLEFNQPKPSSSSPGVHYNNLQQIATMYNDQQQRQQQLLQQKEELLNQILMLMQQQKAEDLDGKRILQELLQRKQRQSAKQKQLQQLLQRQQQMLTQERRLKEMQRNNMQHFEQSVDVALSELPNDNLNAAAFGEKPNNQFQDNQAHQGNANTAESMEFRDPVVTETIYYDVPPTQNLDQKFKNWKEVYRRNLLRIANKFKRPQYNSHH